MNIAQTIYTKVQSMPPQQMMQVLDFVDFLQAKSIKKPTKKQRTPDILQYAGMVKIQKTGQQRSLLDFDPASVARDE